MTVPSAAGTGQRVVARSLLRQRATRIPIIPFTANCNEPKLFLPLLLEQCPGQLQLRFTMLPPLLYGFCVAHSNTCPQHLCTLHRQHHLTKALSYIYSNTAMQAQVKNFQDLCQCSIELFDLRLHYCCTTPNGGRPASHHSSGPDLYRSVCHGKFCL